MQGSPVGQEKGRRSMLVEHSEGHSSMGRGAGPAPGQQEVFKKRNYMS